MLGSDLRGYVLIVQTKAGFLDRLFNIFVRSIYLNESNFLADSSLVGYTESQGLWQFL